MINNTTNISEEDRKLLENKTSDGTNKIKFIYSDKTIENENEEPSPFKKYEDEYCSKCQDYRGCLGLIDSMSMDTDTQDNKKSGYEVLDSTTKAMINNATKGLVNMAFSMRFKMILDCTNMRKYITKEKIQEHDK